MRNFTEMGYETITVIRSEYPPIIGKCLSISPVLWIQSIEKENSVDKEEKRFFIFSRNNCIKEIYEISQAINDYIDGIITSCGTILPIDNKIEFLSSEGIDIECVDGKIRFAIKAPLDPSLGGTGFITYNEGDILVGNKDGKLSILLKGQIGQALGIKEDGTIGYIDTIQKCPTETEITENAFPRWDNEGKCLKNSKTIQDDDGNITTHTSFDGVLTDSYRNNFNGVDKHALREVAVGAGAGLPIFRINRVGTQVWDLACARDDKSFYIRGTNETKPSEVGDILRLYKNGIFTAINQPKASCRLTKKTPNFPINEWFTIGSNLAFEKIRDEDGFNKSANNLNLGGSADGTYITLPYKGTWDIGYQFVIDVTLNTIQVLVEFRVCWGKSPDYQRLKSQFYITNEYYRTIEGSKRLPLEEGDRVFFQIRCNNGNPYLNTFASAQDNEIDNYIGFLYLGF